VSAQAVLSLVGRGDARQCKRADFDAAARVGAGDRTVAEAALAAIRYADPASFTTATAVAHALASRREAVLAVRDRVGVIAVSADGPVEAMAAMTQAGREGSSSPIRFPASNAGSLVGLSSIGFTLRGPTLMLTLPPERGVPVALLLARAFLSRGVADYMFVATCAVAGESASARCLLLGPSGAGEALGEVDTAWLAGDPRIAG
jgi:hypothetical protein